MPPFKPILLIIPGWGGSPVLWEEFVLKLDRFFEVRFVSIDGSPTISEVATDLLADAPREFYLMGHSMGGWTAQHMALQAPERIKALFLLSSWTGEIDKPFRMLLQVILHDLESGSQSALFEKFCNQMVHPARLQDHAFMEKLRNAFIAFPNDRLIYQTQLELHGGDASQRVTGIAPPSHVIFGDGDTCFGYEMQLQLHTCIPCCSCTYIPETVT